jgi:GAF domain-containing protein/HAMP domain-containing protein
MNLTPSDQILQYIAWGAALVEFILALYVLLLNAWHTANRHVSGLLLIVSLNSLGLGLIQGATNVAQAVWLTYILATTTASMHVVILLAAVTLLQPDWLRGRWRRAWWPIYGLVFLPALLILLDVEMGTRLWYTGLDAEVYTGGYPSMTQYTAGSLSSLVTGLYLRILPLLPVILALYTILNKKTAPLTRRLAWLLLVVQIASLFFQLGLRGLFPVMVRSLLVGLIWIIVYTYVVFQQMISERRMQRGRLPIRLTAVILAITVPVFVAMTGLFFFRARVELKDISAEQLQGTNRALATTVSLWLDLNTEALWQLVILPDIVSMDAERQGPIVEAMATTHPHMYLISTTDLDGINVARSDGLEPRDYSDRSWFLKARDSALLTFQSLIDRTSGEPAIVASMPIKDSAGAIIGVGMFASHLTDLSQEIRVSHVGETGVTYVVDGNNLVIAHPDPTFSAELRDLSEEPPVTALRRGKQGLITFTDAEGIEWYASVSELDNGWGVVVQQEAAELTEPLDLFQMIAWAVSIVSIVLLGLLISLAIRQALFPIGSLIETATAIAAGDLTIVAPVESEDEIGALARTFNSMTAQLRSLIGALEQRVAGRTHDLDRRTRYLEASAQVARDATLVLEPQQLLKQVVTLVSEQFGFYHTGIFLLDEEKEWAVLQAASSEGGQRMLARSHRLRVGQAGIVGYVTARGESRVALDTGSDTAFFDNPDLPETRSEVALPLRAHGEIIGALDVQSRESGAFSDEDVAVLEILADQMAMAISNTRLFQQAQASLEAERRAYGALSGEAWAEMLRAQPELGYHCDASGVTAIIDQSDGRDEEGLPELAIPVTVRGQTIGVINAHKPKGRGEWTAEEITLVETLTEQLGAALESARLFQDTQRRAARERLIGEVTARIRETLDMEAVLKTAAGEMRQALGLDRLVVRLAPGETNGDLDQTSPRGEK